MSGSLVETAEQLVVLQTQNLDTYDQALHGAYKGVAQYDNQPVSGGSVFEARQHQHNLHHSRVADCERADTDEGQGVGEEA